MLESLRRSLALLSFCALLSLPAPVPAATPDTAPEPTDAASLASIAASLERIEALLRLGQSSRLLELRLERVNLLRDDIAPLEAQLRSFRSSDVSDGPELKLQEDRVARMRDEMEKAKADGNEDDARMLEMNLRESELQVQVEKRRAKQQRAQAELVENRLSGLRADRDAALAEIDRLLARLELDMRREQNP